MQAVRKWCKNLVSISKFSLCSVIILYNLDAFIVGELLFLLLFLFKLMKTVIRLSIPSFEHFSIWLLELTGLRLGMIGLFCMVFLFLPVARGSVLLRLIDIPFEHATRYHVWLGHLTMLLFTLHGLFYVIGWGMRGNLRSEVSPLAFIVPMSFYMCFCKYRHIFISCLLERSFVQYVHNTLVLLYLSYSYCIQYFMWLTKLVVNHVAITFILKSTLSAHFNLGSIPYVSLHSVSNPVHQLFISCLL